MTSLIMDYHAMVYFCVSNLDLTARSRSRISMQKRCI